MGLMDRLRSAFAIVPESRDYPLTLQDWVDASFTYNGNFYQAYPGMTQTLVGNREEIAGHYTGLIHGAYKSNGVVFACMLARMMLFSEARFQFRQLRGGRPGDLFGNEDLAILERPWPTGTTADLLSRAIQDADIAGTAFMVRRGRNRIVRLRPDWVTMVIGSPYADADDDLEADDIDAELIGLIYYPGGPGRGRAGERILAQDAAVFAPIPDPAAHIRGMSWLTPIIRDIQADTAATTHKERFFVNGATVNLVVQTGLKPDDLETFTRWVAKFNANHAGVQQAFKTLFLTAGADAKPIGANLDEADYKQVQAIGETRIAAASGIHPSIVGLSEGLQGSSLNAGNFEAAARLTANKTLRPLWRNFAHSMESIVPPPPGAELWYDDRDIPFLAEDIESEAKVQSEQAGTIQKLINAGYMPDSVVDAVTSGDFKRLSHTGLYSVQLQPPMPEGPPPAADTNGQGPKEEANAVVSQAG